jgi:hypothetical protein
VLTTISGVLFVALAIAVFVGMLENPYAGLIVFVALPALFLVGLLLIPIGVRLERRRLQRDPGTVADWPVVDLRLAGVRRTVFSIVALTGVNLVILLLAGYGGLHYMESPAFCGQACHAPMHPQFTAWQNGAHARIPCVSCHIGEGAAGFLHAKLSGVHQLVAVTTGNVPQPIPPGTNMRPGAQAQTCLGCHQPGRLVGDRISVIREYADDETNSETTTILQMYVGSASSSGRSIHWHADPAVRIEYVATDNTRKTIPFVQVTDAKGQVKEYVTPKTGEQTLSAGVRRTMDCIDCHNTVGHPISQTPERAVDSTIAAGLVSRTLPYARREAVRLMTAHAGDDEGGAIERDLRKFYDGHRGTSDPEALTRTVSALQKLQRTNVFPGMKVTWGSYPNNQGHTTSDGCFRCHDGAHEAKDGSTISGDCEYCHKQIEPRS